MSMGGRKVDLLKEATHRAVQASVAWGKIGASDRHFSIRTSVTNVSSALLAFPVTSQQP